MSPRAHARSRAWLVGLALLGACGDDSPVDEVGDETGPPIFEPDPAACGNGYLEPGEQCDDANLEDGDGCDSLCRIPCSLLWEVTVPSTSADADPRTVDMAVGPSGEIVVVGTLDALTAELDDDIWVGAFDRGGEPLWSRVLTPLEDPPEELAIDQLAAGVAIAPTGDVYVAGTIDLGDDTDIWVGRFDAAGEQVWSASFDGAVVGAKDEAGGVAVAASGNPIVAGHQRVADKDSDLWLAELDAADGAIVWQTTWSGAVADNGYSLDRGGPVRVGPGQTIWVMGVEYVDYQTFDAHLFAFTADGALLRDWAPHTGESPGHEHVPIALAVGADGRVVFGIQRLGPGATFWVHTLDAGELGWVLDMDGVVDGGEDWGLGGLAAAATGQVYVGGSLLRDEKEDEWREGWMHRLTPDGAAICESRHVPAGPTVQRPNLYVGGLGAGIDGLLLAGGSVVDIEGQRSFWLGGFRGP